MLKKGPEFLDCNEYQSQCTRKGSDPFMGCPTCEFTIQRKMFVDGLTKDINELAKRTDEGDEWWPPEKLIELVLETSSFHQANEKLDPSVSMVVWIMVNIYRGEESKIKHAETYKPDPLLSDTKGPKIKDEEPAANPYASRMRPKIVDEDD